MEFLKPPYLQVVPDFYKFETGPNPMFFKYTPGTRAFIQCIGTGAPLLPRRAGRAAIP